MASQDFQRTFIKNNATLVIEHDEKQLAFISKNAQGISQLLVFNRETGKLNVLLNGSGYTPRIGFSLSEVGSQIKSYTISTKDGSRQVVGLAGPEISPDGKYLVDFDHHAPYDIMSFEIATGRIQDISQEIPLPYVLDEGSLDSTKWVYVWGWNKLNGDLIVSDRFDLWDIALEGRHRPINLTNGFGRKSNMEFNIVRQSFGSKGDSILLSAIDFNTEQSGFYRISYKGLGDPDSLSMGPYFYDGVHSNETKVKRGETIRYMMIRESERCSPNYYWTSDFKRFFPVSKVHPEDQYNWLYDELVTFQMPNGRTNQGTLYKPENFDPDKKYPSIICYYEVRSNSLHWYVPVGPRRGDDLSIPWFTSHGYIVFIPDIHFRNCNTGETVLNTVLKAREYLTGFNWIDSNHIGLQGASYGGWETNYLVTHTTLFAAAMSASGVSNLVSESGDIWGREGDDTKQHYYEDGQGRMRATLWEHPERYIENSPIFYLQRVRTPLLIEANRADGNVSYIQGMNLFLGLRRLGKFAWMLQYDNGSHGLGGSDFRDVTIRMQQFFDYYLKGEAAPEWMCIGIHARDKQINDGYRLMPFGVGPKSTLLLLTARNKMDSVFNRQPITIMLP